jgi:hypothetical protein
MATAINNGAAAGIPWITVRQAAAFMDVDPRTVYRRIKPGYRSFLASMESPDGERMINALSMPLQAQKRWQNSLLDEAERPKLDGTSASQRSLLPVTEIDKKIAALRLSPSERDCVIRRYRIVDLCLNSNWRAEGYLSKTEFKRAVAKRHMTSVASINRWVKAWKQSEDLLELVNDRPGPAPGTGSSLDADSRLHVRADWIDGLNITQCYRRLEAYLEGKQNSPGCRVSHFYSIPSLATVSRFIRSLGPVDRAFRAGAEELKAALPYVDRTYRSLCSLERVETDEWKCDFFCYLPNRPKECKRFWLLTFYDERSMFPLVWKLVEGESFDKRHGIKQDDEIDLLVCLLREFGVPGALVSDRGRFRGGTFGGNDRFKEADGILDRLGITHTLPRDKNPRRARLERFHRFLADCCRTIPGWIGANDEERKMTPGDAQAALHQRCVAGDPDVPKTPLLSIKEARLRIDEWMEQWRDHESRGTDMDGLSPRAVFQNNVPVGGFKRLSEGEIAWKTAETFPNTLIQKGGVVQLRDGKRYSHPRLIQIQGDRREVGRLRHDHSQICVRPSAKGEEPIYARLRERIDVDDPDVLSREMEYQARIAKIFGETTKPLDWNFDGVSSEPESRPRAICAEEVVATQKPSDENSVPDSPGGLPELVTHDPAELRRALWRGERVRLAAGIPEEAAVDNSPKKRVVPLDFPEMVT